jgi:hypothetical protein
MGTEGSSLGAKRPMRESDNSPPSNADVKNCGAILSPPLLYMDYSLINFYTETNLPLPYPAQLNKTFSGYQSN